MNAKKTLADISFAHISAVFGKSIDDDAVSALFAGRRAAKSEHADESYIGSKAAGFELMARGQKIHTLFAFSEGVRGFKGFAFPFGITAGPRKALLALLGAPLWSFELAFKPGGPPLPYTSWLADRLWLQGAQFRDEWQISGFDVAVVSGPLPDDRARNAGRRSVLMMVEVTPSAGL